MENSFLNLCIKHICENYSSLVDSTIIVPNRRAISFITDALHKQFDKPIFLPKMVTIQDFCCSLQQASIPEDFTLIYHLYNCYTKAYKGVFPEESFEDFYSWGEMLLSDFDDIDKYLINYQAIFSNIADEAEIKNTFDFLNQHQIDAIKRFWEKADVENKNSKDVRKNFIEFWNKLLTIYEDFQQILRENNLCYEGMAIRSIVENLEGNGNIFFGNRNYIFIGFNAINKCEEAIFSYLKRNNNAKFYWDYDVYYLKDNINEAGYFIRQNLEKFPNELDEHYFNNFAQEKDIRIIRTTNELAQAKICPELLNQIKETQGTIEDTAIILADEKLITPLLNSIPQEIKANITLGYPLRTSVAYSFFENILDMYQNMNKDKFYFKDIIKLCESPLIPNELQHKFLKLREKIKQDKLISIARDSELFPQGDEKLSSLFNVGTTPTLYVQELIKCIEKSFKELNLNELDKNIFYSIYTILNSLQTIVNQNKVQFQKIRFINTLLKRSLQSNTIAIKGEQLHGLQVMGILEARLLDFKNIILTSVTDGNLPKTSVGNSFIPYFLRIAYGMPTIKEQSSMYSYYFYRLIQRCQNLTLLYNEGTGENKCERSRFILQLLYESPFAVEELNKNGIKGISQIEYSYNISPTRQYGIEISKDTKEVQDYFELIKSSDRKHNYLSPSALKNYITCPMKFYFQNIRKLNEPQEVEEMAQSLDFGNYFHHSMENLYTCEVENPETHKKELQPIAIEKDTIEKILADDEKIEKAIDKAMLQSKATENIRNHKSPEFISTKERVKMMLEYDKQKMPFSITGIEKEVIFKLPNGVNIGGKIDREDFWKGEIHIYDYKTGNCTPNKLQEKITIKIPKKGAHANEEFYNLFNYGAFQDEALQTYIYAYILKEKYPTKNIVPNLLFIQALKDKNFSSEVTLSGTSYGDKHSEFGVELAKKVDEILDTTTKFTKNTKACQHCCFQNFCGEKESAFEGF